MFYYSRLTNSCTEGDTTEYVFYCTFAFVSLFWWREGSMFVSLSCACTATHLSDRIMTNTSPPLCSGKGGPTHQVPGDCCTSRQGTAQQATGLGSVQQQQQPREAAGSGRPDEPADGHAVKFGWLGEGT